MDEAVINPRWLGAVVQDRGLPAIDLPAITAGLAVLSTEQRVNLHALIGRVHSGAERASDLETLSGWIRTTKAAWLQQQALAPAPVVQDASHDMPVAETLTRSDLEGLEVANNPGRAQFQHPAQKALDRLSHHVYGTSADCCVEPTVIEDFAGDRRRPPFHTICVEMAPIVPGTKHYAWENKISVRLTRREMPCYAAVLLGLLPAMNASKHGTAHDKAIDIVDQGSHIFIKLRQGAKALAVKALPDDVFVLAAMVEEALLRNAPTLDSQTVLLNLKRYAAMTQYTDSK